MRKTLLLLGVVACLAAFHLVPIQNAQAYTIDTRGAVPGETGSISVFGSPASATYGQTFSVAGPSELNSFSLFLSGREGGAGTLDLRGYIASWDGTKASSILYESSTQTMNADGILQEFYFDTGGLSLLDTDYVAFLSISNLAVQPFSTFGMPFNTTNPIDGLFVFLNNGTNFGELTTEDWVIGWVGANDAWFTADITPAPVPEPSTFLLLGGGLAGLAFVARRRKKE